MSETKTTFSNQCQPEFQTNLTPQEQDKQAEWFRDICILFANTKVRIAKRWL